MDLELKDYKVLVTASSQGIGRGIAEVLLEQGARVVINGRRKDVIEKAVKELSDTGRVHGVVADITVKEEVERLVDKAANLLGGLDAIVYVTGSPKPGRFAELSDQDWVEGTRLLVMSAVWLVRKALRYLESSENPSITLLSSIAVKEPVPNLSLSSVLRISIHGLVKTLSRDLVEKKIRVNAVMPGYIDTSRINEILEHKSRLVGKTIEELRRELENGIPLGRLGKPKEVGYLVAFLISKYASYINGASIPIDGGLLRTVI